MSPDEKAFLDRQLYYPPPIPTLDEALHRALQAVADERRRQNEKWGEQHHDAATWLAILGEEFGEACQAALHDRFGGPAGGTLRQELIQVAAVAVQIVEMLDADGMNRATCAE